MTEIPATLGMRHLALNVVKLEQCEKFYVDLLGMTVEWRPDPDNIYLTSGADNLALHRAPENFDASGSQHLDHLGFILKTPEDVDAWYDYLLTNNIKMKQELKTHRDGARSFYVYDPDGKVVQFIYHPPISNKI